MASIADICNMGLSHLGSDAIVTSISPPDGSVEAGHCARFFPIARAELLDSFAWTFAKKRVALAATTNPSTVWGYAYAVPSDCMNALRVLNSFTLLDYGFLPYYGFVTPSELAVFNERGSADFEIEGNVLLANEPAAVLLYTIDVIDPSKFSPSFVAALGYLMAAYLAGPLIKGNEGAKTAGTFRQVAKNVAQGAMAKDANNSSEPAAQTPESIRARL